MASDPRELRVGARHDRAGRGRRRCGRPRTARHVLAACEPFSGRIALSGACVNRPFDQALAQAALTVDDAALAKHHAARAITASRERNTVVYLCRELVFLAEANRRTGASLTELRPLVDKATAIVERIGAGIVLVDLDRFGLSPSHGSR